MHIQELYVYPIKGAKGIALTEAEVTRHGFRYDRCMVIVDESGRFISQRSHAKLALLEVALQGEQCLLSWQRSQLSINLREDPSRAKAPIEVWSDKLEAYDLGREAKDFLGMIFGQNLRLCLAIPEQARLVKASEGASQAVPYYFADGFPYLVVSQESLDLLNEKLQKKGADPVRMNRFRPNIVVKGWRPHGEDQVGELSNGSITWHLARPCTRCNVTQVEQETATVGLEPIPTLASYRKILGGKICFGMNSYLTQGEGHILRLNDLVKIT